MSRETHEMRLFSIKECITSVFEIGAVRFKSTASSKRWLARQAKDPFVKRQDPQYKQDLENTYKARSAYKLLEINEKHKIFDSRKPQTVVDLGFAPGAWSQVAVSKISPRGRVLGVDILPANPPKGASAMQANFMSRRTHLAIIRFLSDPERGRRVRLSEATTTLPGDKETCDKGSPMNSISTDLESYIDREKRLTGIDAPAHHLTDEEIQTLKPKLVDVVLSDMLAPFPSRGFMYSKSLSNPRFRMANTTGLKVADHGASIDLCDCALLFCLETLRDGGHFVCKFFSGAEAAGLKKRMQMVFKTVQTIKPESSRAESKEAYYVGKYKKPNISRTDLTW